MRILLALGIVAALCASAVAQQQEPTFRTGIDLIAVDVAVVDGQGRPVEDLRAPDFVVKIDGEERRVASAELVKVDLQAARREADDTTETFFTSNLTPPNARLVVLAVDQSNIHPASIKPLLSAASRFLNQLSPLDEVAFVTFPGLGPRVGFTRDRLRVRLAMEQVIGQPRPVSVTTLNIGVIEAFAIEGKRDQTIMEDVIARECVREVGQQRANCADEVLIESTRIAQATREAARLSFNGIRDLLQRLQYMEGPKSLVLISEGFATDDADDLLTLARLAGMARTTIYVMATDLTRGDVTIERPGPTENADRQLQLQGLQSLAVMARGALFNIAGTGEGIFNRLASEMSAYYLLGVEQRPGDDDERRRRIDVEVRRRDVTIRSRQAFVLSRPITPPRRAPADTLSDALSSPFGVTGLPLRVTTFAQQDAAPGKVQLMIAAEVGAPGAAAGEHTVGFLLVDQQNRVAANVVRSVALTPATGSPTEPLSFVGAVSVDPGVYQLRFGVIDAEGRVGSVARDVNAWQLAGEEFATGDLFVGNVPAGGQGVRPAVEAHVTAEAMAMVLDLYSTSDATWPRATVTFEIAEDEDAPALMSRTGELSPGRHAGSRTASGIIGAAAIPPGRYVARAQIRRDGKLVSVLARPIVVERAAGTRSIAPVATAAAAVSFASTLPRFERTALLTPEVVGAMLDMIEKRTPALAEAVGQARAGRYGMAALDALSEGDQTVAAFLRGLELFAKGALDEAVTQLDISSGARREFFPAAFYLGAALAAAGRDRDAAGIWQLAMGTEPRPAAFYVMGADARMRDGQAQAAIDILKPAYDREPGNDEFGRRLGMAYVMTGQFAAAIPVLDGVLSREVTDEDLLLAAIIAYYEAGRGGQVLSNVERTRLRRYATAYRGPHASLVDRYLETLQVP